MMMTMRLLESCKDYTFVPAGVDEAFIRCGHNGVRIVHSIDFCLTRESTLFGKYKYFNDDDPEMALPHSR